MKIVITLFFSLATVMLSGQNFYNPSVHIEPYAELTNGIKQQEVPGNPGLYQLTLSNPLVLFNDSTGTDLTIGAGGFIISQNPTHSFAVDPFLADLVEGSTNSGIYIEFDSSSVPHRLSVEWRNMKLVDHPTSDYVNFIAHIYSDQSVEYHYGPSQVTDSVAFNTGTGPAVFLIWFQGSFGTPEEYHKMIGDPSSPSFINAPSLSKLSGTPNDGTLYRYEPFFTSVDELDQKSIAVYPNPVVDWLTIEGLKSQTIKATRLNGEETTIQLTRDKADMRHLKPGLYVLEITNESDVNPSYVKILKK